MLLAAALAVPEERCALLTPPVPIEHLPPGAIDRGVEEFTWLLTALDRGWTLTRVGPIEPDSRVVCLEAPSWYRLR